jgi:hypothetical protein
MIARGGRVLTTAVAIVAGLFVLTDLFVSQWPANILDQTGLRQALGGISALFVGWVAIIVAFALFLGFLNVFSVHTTRIRTKKPGAVYSWVLLLSLAITLGIGFLSGGPSSDGSQFIFDYILQPLEATFFSLLAIFMITAAFRAFRIRNLETFFFVFFAVIVLLGQIPLGVYLWSEFPVIKDWILNVPTLAGVRGILLGVALGTIATGLRIIIGADRPYTD